MSDVVFMADKKDELDNPICKTCYWRRFCEVNGPARFVRLDEVWPPADDPVFCREFKELEKGVYYG